MTVDTEQRFQTAAPAETAAKPPAAIPRERGHRLFQTMDELRTRNGNGEGTKERLCARGPL